MLEKEKQAIREEVKQSFFEKIYAELLQNSLLVETDKETFPKIAKHDEVTDYILNCRMKEWLDDKLEAFDDKSDEPHIHLKEEEEIRKEALEKIKNALY